MPPDGTYTQGFYQPFISVEEYLEVRVKVEELFPGQRERIKRHLVMYVVNLICSPEGSIAVSRDKTWFKKTIGKSWHGSRPAVRAQDLLIEKGLVTFRPGYRSQGFTTGFGSVLTITDRYRETFGTINRRPVRLDTSESVDMILKNTDTDRTTKYKGISATTTEFTFKATTGTQVTTATIPLPPRFEFQDNIYTSHILNTTYFNTIEPSFNTDIEPDMARTVHLTRIFTRMGSGRFFQQHSKSYQNIPKESRQHLLINGEPTVEVDYSGMHINLLYAKERVQAPTDDMYMPVVRELIGSDNAELRTAVKRCILIAINAKNLSSYKKAMRYNHPQEIELLRQHNIELAAVIEAFGRVHAPIARYLNSDASIELMYEDSKVLAKVLLKLKEQNILGLPLHDSIICQSSNATRVKEIMQQIYQQHTGYTIPVEIKTTTRH